ncbi:hypothetical protein LMH87_001338 [Akanthomyces muscarius]|uniref:beta-N-acetylhexosaminidase n=1 Tax=Akanthomyces muscarius TaxID=2231603 RepID=A0A9W8UPR7_AKAMU|nr:hypothetical protein LMH87_001338 [Akanthomyces muscarius]KAJ4156125.1 hypothetical protein LMH87_001338 [Akanthomyces muscarius]
MKLLRNDSSTAQRLITMVRNGLSQVVLSALACQGTTAALVGIPTVDYTTTACKRFDLQQLSGIVVDARYADARDTRGSTLVPPTLADFARTFAADLASSLGIQTSVSTASAPLEQGIHLTLDPNGNFTDAAGRITQEGYSLTTNSSGIFIAGASPLGAWWATRTVLQQAAIRAVSKNVTGIPYGHGRDAPGWGMRGMMLDAGRHWYPKEFLIEMCSYMSYFKQNTFHLHLSDNLVTQDYYSYEQSMSLEANFRLYSENAELNGLSSPRDVAYTRDDFEEIQQKCAARGVTIMPEIEAPGHALRIVQWKPELGFHSDPSLLNISHPSTIPTMKAIWAEFLPWFHTKLVSIGADEYHGPVADYNHFVNTMHDFISSSSNKTMSIWGTFPPKYDGSYDNIHQDVAVQHWEFFEDKPLTDYIRNNYSVINSDDTYYVVNKYSESYPSSLPLDKTFSADPSVPGGGPWYPNVFSAKDAAQNPSRNEPRVLGSIVPMWNDFGQNATVVSEAYYAWREGLPAVADKQWGGKLTRAQFDTVLPQVHPYAPGQNLDRAIPSKGSTIFQYSFESIPSRVVKDLSGNAHVAHTTCMTDRTALQIRPGCAVTLPFASKGRDYTLSISIKLDSNMRFQNATILTGTDSALLLAPTLTLLASNNYYPLNLTLPINQWVDVTIRGKGAQTFGSILPQDGFLEEEEFQRVMGIAGKELRWAPIAVEAPLGTVAGFNGMLRNLTLTNSA